VAPIKEGYVSEDWIALIQRLDSNGKEEILSIISKISRTGHTSGYDMLFGFYLGLLSLK